MTDEEYDKEVERIYQLYAKKRQLLFDMIEIEDDPKLKGLYQVILETLDEDNK